MLKRLGGCGGEGYVLGMLVDKDDLINYQLLIIYQLLIRTFTYQPTVDKTIVAVNQLLTLEGLLMIVDKVWKLTNTVRVGLDARTDLKIEKKIGLFFCFSEKKIASCKNGEEE